MTVCAKQLWLCAKKKAFMMELTNILGTSHDPVLNKYIQGVPGGMCQTSGGCSLC